jgi:hypothetical protein
VLPTFSSSGRLPSPTSFWTIGDPAVLMFIYGKCLIAAPAMVVAGASTK